MKKVYIVIENYTFEYKHEVKVSVYDTKEKAKEHFNYIVKKEKKDSWIATERNVVEYKTKSHYTAYRAFLTDGYAGEFETNIRFEEKEVW